MGDRWDDNVFEDINFDGEIDDVDRMITMDNDAETWNKRHTDTFDDYYLDDDCGEEYLDYDCDAETEEDDDYYIPHAAISRSNNLGKAEKSVVKHAQQDEEKKTSSDELKNKTDKLVKIKIYLTWIAVIFGALSLVFGEILRQSNVGYTDITMEGIAMLICASIMGVAMLGLIIVMLIEMDNINKV